VRGSGMSPLDLFFLLRRHKWVLVTAVLVGLAAGWLTAPGASKHPQEYQATHTLIINPRADATNLAQAPLLATAGAVPEQAAKALGVDEQEVTDTVTAEADLKVASLSIIGTSTDPAFAEHAADAVADALVTQLSGTAKTTYDNRLAELNGRADQLRATVAAGASSDPAAQADLNAELASTLQSLNALASDGPPPAALISVQKAKAEPVATKGISAPNSKPARAGLLGAFGLLIGIGAIFALDRLDTRIHTKGGAEAAFGFPVIAEIPPLPAGAHRELLSESRPASQFVEAYRGLRTHLALAGEEHGLRPPEAGQGSVILITSPLAGEGKTTSVAHVAAMLGEVGRSVLVVSADFRRPRLHELFHRERGPGLSEVLGGELNAPDVADLDLHTPVKGVQFIASGAPVSNPAVVVKRTPAVLEAAQPFWEFIVVDSAPLLVANDSSDLARAANGVVVMARSGRTTIDAAERTSELLRRIEANVLGVVLIAASESPTAYRYYRTQYYADDQGEGGWWERRRRRHDRSRRPSSPASSNGAGTTTWEPAERSVDNVQS
jgi:capsular exopolysaccharide synthesis family protein